ncbi:LysR substrate-binding domain-containing protein [uncultured Hoeflea sp.]|jgi:DNA-binding transcriptional LysR family regulator|uniref:LysR substrate-binding domain-containing protein n=1 Tax=uncultured Hoeflea sp. TaxID=538666 RepID=UPI0030D85606
MNTLSLDIRILRSLQSVSETGNITESARRLGRTQPAITLQLQRLEDICGFNLFRSEGRKMLLTPDGALVLSYANSIIRLHDELLSRLQAPDVEGHVVLGTPDLYAAFILPSVLALFRQAFPRVQVQLQCSLSTPLVKLVHRGEVDLALVTRMNDFSGGKVVRQEQLIWMTGDNSTAHTENPVPLALLPPGNIYRDHAIECLEAVQHPWRIACVSESVSGLQAAVFAGMAVTVLGRSALVSGMREIVRGPDYPSLPKVDLLLYKAPGTKSAAANALHDYLAHYLPLLEGGDLLKPVQADKARGPFKGAKAHDE